MKINLLVLAALLGVLLLGSCADNAKTGEVVPTLDSTGVSSSGTMKYEGEIISVPSPIEVAILIQKNKVPYKQELLNGLQNKSRYLNETKKALNLGIYGADLAYVANYNLGQINNDYFDVIASMASELGVLENIDKKLVAKINSSLGNRDSILKMNSDFFRVADRYLKNNERPHLSSMILIGGWIESMHLTADASKDNAELKSRLGEQKYTAPSIQSVASKLDDPAFNPVKVELLKLCELLSSLTSNYTYKRPINDQREKITYLLSQCVVELDEEKLTEIRNQVNVVRNLIIE